MGLNFLFRAIQFGLMHVWPLVVLLVAAAILPPDRLGDIALLVAVGTLMRPLIGASLGRAALRVTAQVRAAAIAAGRSPRRAADAAAGVLHVTTRTGLGVCLIGSLLAIAAVLSANAIYGLFDAVPAVLLACGFVIALGLVEFFDGVLRVAGRFGLLAGALVISRLGGAIVLLAGLLLSETSSDRVIALLLALFVCELLCAALLVRPALRLGTPPLDTARSEIRRNLFVQAAPVVINALSVYVYARAMVLVAGLFDTSARVGGMELAIQIANLPMAVTIVIASVLAPALGALAVGRRGEARVQLAVSRGAAFALWVGIMGAIALGSIGPAALRWLLPQHPVAAEVLYILAPLVALKAMAQILSGEVSIARGGAQLVARITLVFGVVTVAAGVAGAQWAGVQGAAWALLLGHIGAVVATIILLPRVIGIVPRYRVGDSLILGVPVALATGAVIWLLPAGPAEVLGGSAVFALICGGFSVMSWRHPGAWYGRMHRPLRDGLRLVRARKVRPTAVAPVAGRDDLPETLIAHMKLVNPHGMAFWLQGIGDPEDADPQDHADIVYSMYLMGRADQLNGDAAQQYQRWLALQPLAGRTSIRANVRINVHLSAYLLSTSRLLDKLGHPPVPDLYDGWQPRVLVDATGLPRWPRAWSHHVWRVSHWIGGAPSILLHLAHAPIPNCVGESDVRLALSRCEDQVILSENGALKPWRSKIIQRCFRRVYRFRHDPDAAEIGGIVHLLWIYHALDMPIVGAEQLHKKAIKILWRKPIIENVPYCLDFDIVQVARLTQPKGDSGELVALAQGMADAIIAYLSAPPSDYTLHRLPGAYAALHECALITGQVVPGTAAHEKPLDVIKDTYWL